jgi:hypothetical protein
MNAIGTSLLGITGWMLLGCGSGPGSIPDPDSAPTRFDSSPRAADAPTGAITLPTWMLQDIQPQSPMFNQTYGVDSFAGKIIVVTLLEGF